MHTDFNFLLQYKEIVVALIKAYDKWPIFAGENQKPGSDEDEGVTPFGNLLLKIRQDILGTTRVTVHEISNLNPFNRG